MTNLSNNAFAIVCYCPESKRQYGITVDLIGPKLYSLIWAFKINMDKAKREGFDKTTVQGNIQTDENYPGCPYCGTKQIVVCACGGIICYHGERTITCPKCNMTGAVTEVDGVTIKGGGY